MEDSGFLQWRKKYFVMCFVVFYVPSSFALPVNDEGILNLSLFRLFFVTLRIAPFFLLVCTFGLWVSSVHIFRILLLLKPNMCRSFIFHFGIQ